MKEQNMTKKKTGEAEHKAAEENVLYAAARLGAVQSRVGGANPFNYFTGLEGQAIYIGGHRFSVVAMLTRIEITGTGEALGILDDVYQIDDDRDDGIQGGFRLGDGFRFPESCVGFGVQPLSGTSSGYQASYEKLKQKK